MSEHAKHCASLDPFYSLRCSCGADDAERDALETALAEANCERHGLAEMSCGARSKRRCE